MGRHASPTLTPTVPDDPASTALPGRPTHANADKIPRMTPVDQARALEPALAALVGGVNRDPFAVLGPHGRGLVSRLSTGGASDRAAPRLDRRAAADDEAGSGGDVRGPAIRARTSRARLPAAHHLSRRSRRRDRRSVPVRPRADRLRSAPARRRDASPRVREARRAPHHGRDDGRRSLRGVGAERRSRQRRRRLQRLGRPRARRCGCWRPAASGRSSFPICADGEKYKFEIRAQGRRDSQEDRSVRRARSRCRRSRPRSSTTSRATLARRRRGWRRARRAARGSIGRCRSTRCTSARGRGCPRKATGSSPTARWRTGSSRT